MLSKVMSANSTSKKKILEDIFLDFITKSGWSINKHTHACKLGKQTSIFW